MKKLIITVVSSLVLVAAAHADNRPFATAGCGLGSQVMGKDGSQVLASTTNGTSGSQTFGISSGTSNCTDSGTVAARKAVPAYIEANREALSTDVARGSGETLAGLSNVMGCSDAQELAGSLKKNYKEIFSSDDASLVTKSVMDTVKQDAALSCKHVI